MHYHVKNGFFVKCYRQCRSTLLSGTFWIGLTVSYPFEHWLWEKVWPFSIIGHFLIGH